MYEIGVRVKDGYVTLSGVVNSLYNKTCARIIASRVLEVNDAVNNIVVNKGS